jgi:hypothetical protein
MTEKKEMNIQDIDFEDMGKHIVFEKDSGLSFWNIINYYLKIKYKDDFSLFGKNFARIEVTAGALYPNLKAYIDKRCFNKIITKQIDTISGKLI